MFQQSTSFFQFSNFLFLARMNVPFRIWLKIASSRMISFIFAFHLPPLRISRFRFVHGAYRMLILFWTLRCHWIHERPCLLEAFHVHWKHVSFVLFCLFVMTQFPSIYSLVELAMIMDRLYGGVCYAGIDTDPELKYPKVNKLVNAHFVTSLKRHFVLLVRLGCWSCGIFQPAKLHCSHLSSFRSVATWRHWQARRSQAVRARWSDVRRMRWTTLQWQVCTVLLCKCHLSSGELNDDADWAFNRPSPSSLLLTQLFDPLTFLSV